MNERRIQNIVQGNTNGYGPIEMKKDKDRHINGELEQLLEQHKGILFKVARAYCPREDDRQDLIQEMTIQIWRSLPRYDDRFKRSTWLYRIVLNVAISFYRKQQQRWQRQVPMNAHSESTPDQGTDSKEQQLLRLEQLIAELNALDKGLIVLYLEDKSHAEIAEILGLSVSNVGTRLGRIREKLRQRFSQIN